MMMSQAKSTPTDSMWQGVLAKVFGKAFGKKFWTSLWTAIPYGWYALFLLAPLVIIFSLTFAQWSTGAPPYKPLWTWIEGNMVQLRLSFTNYVWIFQDPDNFYCMALWRSLAIAACSTLLCLVLGYPMAYGIVRSRHPWIWVLLAILPFFTSFLVRIYAWITLLGHEGVINNFLRWLGLGPMPLINNTYAAVVGIVYSYLPFMIFPLYVALQKIDGALIEAAYDLGARPWSAFWRITVPLSRSGIVAGSSLVFIPTVGEYLIPEFLGPSRGLTIGRLIWLEFFGLGDWPMAATLALIMICVLLVPIFLLERLQSFFEEKSSSDHARPRT